MKIEFKQEQVCANPLHAIATSMLFVLLSALGLSFVQPPKVKIMFGDIFTPVWIWYYGHVASLILGSWPKKPLAIGVAWALVILSLFLFRVYGYTHIYYFKVYLPPLAITTLWACFCVRWTHWMLGIFLVWYVSFILYIDPSNIHNPQVLVVFFYLCLWYGFWFVALRHAPLALVLAFASLGLVLLGLPV
ncbi:hypothetical protein [Helicobacter vulpis]|uniref:hypothetical protein n=1 Tax=Helicobacter vulpis TaxID=2316076 RepID=UPI000EB15FEA|nr:hypothetical protein [Helicobacter vulpis]